MRVQKASFPPAYWKLGLLNLTTDAEKAAHLERQCVTVGMVNRLSAHLFCSSLVLTFLKYFNSWARVLTSYINAYDNTLIIIQIVASNLLVLYDLYRLNKLSKTSKFESVFSGPLITLRSTTCDNAWREQTNAEGSFYRGRNCNARFPTNNFD